MQPKPPQNLTKEKDATKPKAASSKIESRKNIITAPSRVGKPNDEDLEGAEETEIAAQITLPPEGGWGWVVVAGAFWCIFILDGVAYTFGSVFSAITEELQMEQSLIALINSIAVALYCSCGPLTSALINRFGFRAIVMTGAIIVSFAMFCTYFAKTYATILLFYGCFAGVGYCFINMSSSLVVGFYFERLRSLALAIATTGSSTGIMVMFPLNSYVVKISGWRTLVLLQSGLFGIIYFLGMIFKPLLSLTVTKTTDNDDPMRTVTVTYLPNVSTQTVQSTQSQVRVEGLMPTATEKLFNAVTNANFPTAAAVVDEGMLTNNSNQAAEAGPSTSPPPVPRLTLTAHAPKGGMSERHLKQVQSILSRTSALDTKRNVELNIEVEAPREKMGCWRRLCHWERHIPQSRPMYRDDVFFDGNLERLPAYQKSKMMTSEEPTGIEYQLAVSRAVTTADLKEKKGMCTTAARRILATMMDPKLLKRYSFLMFVSSGFLICLGNLVPYIFVYDRNKAAGIDEAHCTWFVSAIGFSNAMGRLILGALACKIDPLKLFTVSCFIAGLIIVLSNISFNVYYQYLCCCIYGFFIASMVCLRSMVLVDLYGLDKLTNATGMMLLFQGIACCISTPTATVIKTKWGYQYTFYSAGFFIFLSGICLLPIRTFRERERQKEQDWTNQIGPENKQAPLSSRKSAK